MGLREGPPTQGSGGAGPTSARRERLDGPCEHTFQGWGEAQKRSQTAGARPASGGSRAAAAPATPAAARAAAQPPPSELRSGRMAAGSALFGSLLFLAGAFPWVLPHLFLLFAATALPWRAYCYLVRTPKNAPFLLDFCYAVNLAVAAFLLAPPAWRDARLEAALYALADGPVSGALVAWQCSWVFSSAEHTISVLVHVLPGLAMYAHRHLPRLATWEQLRECTPHLRRADTALHLNACISAGAPPLPPGAVSGALWLLAAPLTFYLAWQALYWLAVQVLGRGLIRRHRLDTSYKCLARRAARADNLWARLVLRGSLARRLLVFGLLQLGFTVGTLLLFLPTYYSFHLAFLWQAVKIAVPVHYGCRYQCERLIKSAVAEGIRLYQLEVDARAPALGSAPPAAAAFAGEGARCAPAATAATGLSGSVRPGPRTRRQRRQNGV